LAGLLGLAACHAGQGAIRDPAADLVRPPWVDRLEEQVRTVPPESLPGGARLSTPTAWPPSAAGPGRGQPRDLTRPWDGTAPVEPPTSLPSGLRSAPVPAGAANGAAHGDRDARPAAALAERPPRDQGEPRFD